MAISTEAGWNEYIQSIIEKRLYKDNVIKSSKKSIKLEKHLFFMLLKFLYYDAPEKEQNFYMVAMLLEDFSAIDKILNDNYTRYQGKYQSKAILDDYKQFLKDAGNNLKLIVNNCIKRVKKCSFWSDEAYIKFCEGGETEQPNPNGEKK